MSEGRKMGHVQSFQTYLMVLGGLVVLTVVTVAVSRFDFGSFNTLIAMLVATVKASLVVLFFMHGRYEDKITWAFIYYPIVLLLLLIGGLFLDYAFRDDNDRIMKQPVIFNPDHHGAVQSDDHDGSDSHGAAPAATEHAATESGHGPVEASADTHGNEAATDAPAGEAPAAVDHADADPWASVSGDAAAGLAKAKVICVACHVVDGAGVALPGAPAFSETMADPEKTPEFLARWLKDPQSIKQGSLMPPLGLSDDDINNLLAYMKTLKQAH